MFLHSCSQTCIKDGRLDSKSFEEDSVTTGTGGITVDFSDSSSFTVSSAHPLEGQTGEGRTGSIIPKTFIDNVRLKNTSGSWSTTYTTKLTSKGSCSVSYDLKLVHTLRDNFSSCPLVNSFLSGKSITLTLNGTLSSLENYNEKVLKTSLN